MCDTFVATPDATADARMLFGKNSDREPFEPQTLDVIPARRHREGSLTRCTYVDVPSVSRTHSVLLARPFWMWGAEMGLNDAGVVIGNEAVMTRAPYQQGPGLLGMDILRLALERAATARRAVEWITRLVEEHGQGGRPSMESELRYHNSFLVADAEEAWVVETADRAWAIARVRGVRSISNGLSLRDDWEVCSDNLAARARDYGLSPGKGRLDFARLFSDPVLTWGAAARRRRGCTEAFLRRHDGALSAGHAMKALRQHGAPDRPQSAAGSLFMTVCGHASWTPTRSSSQTTGSLVCSIDSNGATAWATATSAPCVSTFKPVWITSGLPDIGRPSSRYDSTCLWWRHERLHRRAMANLDGALGALSLEREAFETGFLERAGHVESEPDRRALTSAAFEAADALEARWLERLPERPLPGLAYRRYWKRLDARSGLALAP